jgi:hypothetical protein
MAQVHFTAWLREHEPDLPAHPGLILRSIA